MRRPRIRSLAGGAAGIAAGVIGGVALTAVSTAAPPAAPTAPAITEAAHVPPALRLPGEPVRLRYAIVCTPRNDGLSCGGAGTVYVRAGDSGAFRPLTLERGDESKDGRYYADVPAELTAGPFSYYAVLRDTATGASVTVPSGGADAPQESIALHDPTAVALGRHVFGRTRAAPVRVLEAQWGSAPDEVGLAGSPELGFSGPSSFDVEGDGTVDLLDSVNGRIVRSHDRRAQVVPLAAHSDLADFAAEPDGSFDVLETGGALRRFRSDGTPAWTAQLADRTWAKLARGPSGPVAFQQPSEQWLPLTSNAEPLARSAQARAAHNGAPLPGGRELVVDHGAGRELRIAETARHAVLRSWRITSDTPLGEVQLAEPRGNGVVVVTRAYTDDRDEFVVLVLDRSGLAESFSVASDSWTETAPLARFRLTPRGLYRLHTTPAGAAVDRFDLEVPQ